MIICHCNNVGQRYIIEELKKGVDILEILGEAGVGLCCGMCSETTNELFNIDRDKLLEYSKQKFLTDGKS